MKASLKILRAGKVILETPFAPVTASADELLDIEMAINESGKFRCHLETREDKEEED